MKQKIFTLFAILMMAITTASAKVYESDLNVTNEIYRGQSITIDGITFKTGPDSDLNFYYRAWAGSDEGNSFTISTALGETITCLEITGQIDLKNDYVSGKAEWTVTNSSLTWKGSAKSVSLGENIDNVTHIKITCDELDGITSVTAADKATEVARFDINGARLSSPKAGINIVKMSDGTVKKVCVTE